MFYPFSRTSKFGTKIISYASDFSVRRESFDISADGQKLVFSNGTFLKVVDTYTGSVVDVPPPPGFTSYDCACISRDGRIVAAGYDSFNAGQGAQGAVFIFDVSQNPPAYLRTIVGPTPGGVPDQFGAWFGASVSLNSDGSLIAVGEPRNAVVGSSVGAVYVYNTSTGAQVRAWYGDIAGGTGQNLGDFVSISSDGSTVAGAAEDYIVNGIAQGAAYVFNVDTGTRIDIIQNPEPATVSDNFGAYVRLSDDGSILACSSDDEVSAPNNRTKAHVFKTSDSSLIRTLTQPNGGSSGQFVSISGDGTLLLLGRENGSTNAAFLFNTRTGQPLRTISGPVGLNDDFAFVHALSASGERLAICAGARQYATNGVTPNKIEIYDTF